MSLAFPLPRRRFLAAGAAGLLVPALLGADGQTVRVRSARPVRVPYGAFTLGVASGDPLPDGVVLWTRLAPRPTDGGGMPPEPVEVRWEVATDERFTSVERSGTATARPESAHTVHVDARGLRPGRDYFYRFHVGRETSPVGRTRTAPAPDSRPKALRFATASCQNWQDGFYTAYRGMAKEDVDFVAFLGDYIYEVGPGANRLRDHVGSGQTFTLTDYRNRHAQYRTDVDLARMHAAAPWIVTIDDHDVDDNWTGDYPMDPDAREPVSFAHRKAAALRAFVEHMPLRVGPGFRLFRRFRFGHLATLHAVDTRSYRSRHPRTQHEANAPGRTMTGPEQERWLVRGLAGSECDWNLLANQVMIAAAGFPGRRFGFDGWNGYRAQRHRLLEFLGTGAVSNPVVLTGDQHATLACDLKPDFDSATSPVVGAELVGTSITSGGDADVAGYQKEHAAERAANPHWKYLDNRRGYLVGDLYRGRLDARLRVVGTVRSPGDTTVETAARFVVENGRPGVTLDSSLG
ncbi:alkaline phosphatase D family protein [Cryptosporangium sp. NPDC048952]|uniref:alkaline phosphatase D family protein n=1 Tax=Cryptosporangium sp. NPDC048952 TaxID=3363961 RepID=UPI0037150BC7